MMLACNFSSASSVGPFEDRLKMESQYLHTYDRSG